MTHTHTDGPLITRRGFLAGAGAIVVAGALQAAAGGRRAEAAATSAPFLGEIRMFAGNFAPAGWALCDGATLEIAAYSDLFAAIGTTYGGDGLNSFALPDLRGRLPLHRGGAYQIGGSGGAETATLTIGQMPRHSHTVGASSNAGNTSTPGGAISAATQAFQAYTSDLAAPTAMSPGVIAPVGGGQPHENMPPFLALNFIIALQGVFPL